MLFQADISQLFIRSVEALAAPDRCVGSKEYHTMAKRKYEFSDEDKLKILLWCARHCCLCGKFAGVGIEVAHIEQNKSEIDNAIPLCFDCHAAIGHYNSNHPRGKKYSIEELKARRDQIYEKHTRHLVSPVHYSLTQKGIELPKVGFIITNLGDIYPVQARINICISQGDKEFGAPETLGHYNGNYLWNLNPKFQFGGNFAIPNEALLRKNEPLRALVEITVYDIYERPHKLLPTGCIKNMNSDRDWFFEPSVEELKPKNNKN
jgi:hypothetical protein